MPVVFNALLSGATALDVLVAGRANPQALLVRQRTRLARLLAIAVQRSAVYREKFAMTGLDPGPRPEDLGKLPIVTKSELMQRFDDWVSDPAISLAELQALTADSARIGEAYLGRYVVWESSGTSGVPGIFLQDAAAMAVYDALEATRRGTAQPLTRLADPLYLTERIAFVGATTGHFASFVSIQRLQTINPLTASSLRCFSILKPIADLVDELNQFAPTIVATYPTVACLLAHEYARGSLRTAPREMWTGGENLSIHARTCIEQTLGCAIRNSYGASEFLTIAFECTQGQLHANTDWLVLEPVDENFKAVPLGQPAYTTLLTNLANTVQPLIRYDLGDQITLHANQCKCGSPLPVMEVTGRHDDPLVLRGHGDTSVTLLPLALTTALEEQAGVFDFQVRQHDDHTLELLMPHTGRQVEALLAHGSQVLAAFAQSHGAGPLTIFTTEGAETGRGRSGKVQRVIAVKHSP